MNCSQNVGSLVVLVVFFTSLGGTVRARSLDSETTFRQPPPQRSREAELMERTIEVVDELATIPQKGIPMALIRDARGIAIFPSRLKAGFIFGGRYGRGVLLVREGDGAWSPPVFVSLSGLSVGHQIGVEATDLVLIFRTQDGLDRLRRGKLTIGADVAVVAGPVGRHVELATDATLQSGIMSYSRSRGLFAGVSLGVAALIVNANATHTYNHCIEGGRLAEPPSASPSASERLQMRLNRVSDPIIPQEPIRPTSAQDMAPILPTRHRYRAHALSLRAFRPDPRNG